MTHRHEPDEVATGSHDPDPSDHDAHADGGSRDAGVAALIREARTGWNSPPETPREQIWSAVEGELFGGAVDPAAEAGMTPPRGRAPRFPGPWLAAAAAAVLLLGVGLGRMSQGPTSGAAGTTAADVRGGPTPAGVADATPVPVRMAAAAHLTSTETLLTLVRSDARSGQLDPAVGRWGRRLLTETRLLLDSPAVRDPSLRQLLEELELVLAQVALLADPDVDDARRRDELQLIADGLDEAGVQARLRASLPALTGALAETD
jgi:hypothetical protein